MAKAISTDSDHQSVVPSGELLHLSVEQLQGSTTNPRRLFDQHPLGELRDSIRTHGVLVPLTVYKLPGQQRFAIVDGERRFKCCQELVEEGHDLRIPANVVRPPTKLASLIYMFNIHSFRAQWELMPTALGLKLVMDGLGVTDTDDLHELTGLSKPQIERCRKILSYPDRYQKMSLREDPAERIPSNFWIELFPVLELAEERVPDLVSSLGRNGITDAIVSKYNNKKLKSVIHCRRIVEAFEVADAPEDLELVTDRFREYVLTDDMETRQAFDGFIRDHQQVQKAVSACEAFLKSISKLKIDYAVDNREDVIRWLHDVKSYVSGLLETLSGEDPPNEVTEE